MAILGNQQGVLQQVPIFNYEKTAETAKTINVRCDFALDTVFSGNLSQERRQGVFQSIRTIYFNCSGCVNDVTFTCVDTGQVLTFEAGKSGYLPVLVSQGMSFRFVGTSPDVALFNLLNVDMPPAIWPDASGTPGEIEFSASPRLLGRYSPGAGPGEEVQLGAGLSFVGDTLTMGAGGPYVLKAGDVMTGALSISPASGTSAVANLVADNALCQFNATRYVASANAPTMNFNKARGSLSIPGDVLVNDLLGAFTASGYAGGAFRSGGSFSFAVATATPSATDMASRWFLFLTPAGTVTPVEFIRADHATGFSMYGLNVVIDNNRLLKRRPFTFATLPAAAISQDGEAVITDGAAAPAWLAAAAGGGAVRTPVISNGAAWNNG